jgi:hypothetical protein
MVLIVIDSMVELAYQALAHILTCIRLAIEDERQLAAGLPLSVNCLNRSV